MSTLLRKGFCIFCKCMKTNMFNFAPHNLIGITAHWELVDMIVGPHFCRRTFWNE